MKKITHVLPLLAFCLFVLTSYSQQVSDGFEKQYFPPAGWSTTHVKGAHSWETSVDRPNNGSMSAFINYELIDNGDFGEGDNWLILPRVYSVQSGDKLNFSIAAQFKELLSGSYYENLEIRISTTDANISSFTNTLSNISLSNFATTYNSYSLDLSAYNGQNIYIAFRNHQNQGVGMYLDDVGVTSKLSSDVGVTGINLNNDAIIPTGTTINISATVKNLGSGSLASGIPVKYSINNGTAVVLSTGVSLTTGATTTVNFTGASAFVPSLPGDYLLKVFTDNASETNRGNDSIYYTIHVRTPKSSFPYFQDFTSMDDWTNSGSAEFQFVDHINNAGMDYNVSNPAGDKNKAALAFTYNSYGEDFYLRTPLLNFTTVSKPLLNFYVAAGYFDNTYYDQLQIVVSTDGGVTFDALPLYNKSNITNSKLVTVWPSSGLFYVPNAPSNWRHEIVDLSKYAGLPNVMVAFKVTSGGANNVWIDNVEIVNQAPSLYTSVNVTTAGQTVTGAHNTSVKFNTIISQDSVRIEGNDGTPPNRDNIDPNTSSTNQYGIIETPDFVFDRYFTIAYSGNSLTRANYDISLDITGLPGLFDANKLYILKRSDQTDAWIALTTTRTGNILKASGLTNFSDFAIGLKGSPVPVTVVSINGHQQNNIIQLKWTTSQEVNIDKYEVQRWDGKDWATLGSVASLKMAMQNQYTFEDNMPLQGMNLYRLRITSEIGSVVYSDIAKVQFESSGNRVYQNVPNPFRNQTVIRLDITQQSRVKVLVFNTAGKQIAVLDNSNRQPGTYLLKWNAGNIPAGTYFYKVIINDAVQTRSMLKIE